MDYPFAPSREVLSETPETAASAPARVLLLPFLSHAKTRRLLDLELIASLLLRGFAPSRDVLLQTPATAASAPARVLPPPFLSHAKDAKARRDFNLELIASLLLLRGFAPSREVLLQTLETAVSAPERVCLLLYCLTRRREGAKEF
jgi:hypothetical protein